MPRNQQIKKVLLIGSGPIVIGQAAEFDYAGTQACRVLREEGINIVLVNSNPATIMTDSIMADKIYIEPMNLTTLKRIIEAEQPDSILSGFGGQTGLTLSMQLAKEGYLAERGVRLLGASPETIDKAEDRKLFKETMEKIGQPCIPSEVVNTVEAAERFAGEIGYPVILRPAFTLGGSGGGIVNTPEELRETAAEGLALSPITQILVERCVSGWKEIEFEVVRDGAGNTITVCSMENFDPVGVHTGDSIVIAPAVTLSDKEYQMLRTAAINIIKELGVEGGCNCQFALNPDSFEYAVIEVNPRVSRSSALASKATGYPIAKVAAKIAIGYRLDEIINAVTGTTYAAFEPALDYVAVKFPRWAFDKFVYAKRELGTQMKATGEVMAIARTFEAALMKAVRGVEISQETLRMEHLSKLPVDELEKMVSHATDERLFALYELFFRGKSVEDLHELTMIDRWFLYKIKRLYDYEMKAEQWNESWYIEGKKLGFTDASLQKILPYPLPTGVREYFQMVDTCAGEFAAVTPYFYGVYDRPESGIRDEAEDFVRQSTKERIIVIGSGPIRIGQGIEFDYACVHCVMALQNLGYEVIIINNNPETVSTDFDTGDRLYFEPLHIEDVMQVIRVEKPIGVVVAYGGQTAIKLTKKLSENGIRILGTNADSIDMAEDRARFDALLEQEGIKRPKGMTVQTTEEALSVAEQIGYLVLLRPSYVLGGQNMIIAYNEQDIREYMEVILRQKQDNPVLIDKYLSGIEVEADAICDGEDILIPGIMEHVERTGIHSGDSIAVYPGPHIDDEIREMIYDTTKKLCLGLKAKGLLNLQYIITRIHEETDSTAESSQSRLEMDFTDRQDKSEPDVTMKNSRRWELYVIEVNPRASRTVPYLSKVTGVPMCELATRVSLGERLGSLGYGTGIYPLSPYTAVKVPVFSFEKLTDVDTALGPEMKSTGEVLGIGRSFREALYKGLVASGCRMEKSGGVLISVRGSDKHEVVDIAKKFVKEGFRLYATSGTAEVLRRYGLAVTVVTKIHETINTRQKMMNTIELLDKGLINYVISTSAKGRNPLRDSVKLRRRASRLQIPCLTSLDTANALVDSLMSRYTLENSEIVDINHLDKTKLRLHFAKLQSCMNDYIYINCLEQRIASPEFLSVMLSDRHTGIGGDGVVLIEASDRADAAIRMFNLDGSEGKMCGNALRCVAKYLYDKRIVNRKYLTIDTASGIRSCSLLTKNNQVYRVTVDMGRAILASDKIPVKRDSYKTEEPSPCLVNQPQVIGGTTWNITCVSMGNPHCVVFVPMVDVLDLQKVGPKFEHSDIFPERINAEFVEIIDEDTIKLRVWERGSGETLACGTGACAAAVAAVLNGHCAAGRDIRVLAAGGEMIVYYTEDRVLLTGDCELAFEGEIVI